MQIRRRFSQENQHPNYYRGSEFPVLLFLGLFKNTKENLKNTKDFSHPASPSKPWKISRKRPQRPRKSPRKKHQGNKNTKEKKDRVTIAVAKYYCCETPLSHST